MSWILFSLLSALFLGVYDLLKKSALKDNAALPVLFYSVLSGAIAWGPILLWKSLYPAAPALQWLRIEPIGLSLHLLIILKSILVGFSWLFNYYALRRLPVSIAAPIRSTAPMWTVLLAVLFMGERPNLAQWTGISIVATAFFALALTSSREGLVFHRDKWIAWMLIATILGALSAIYDKYLLQSIGIHPTTLQLWFSLELVLVVGAMALWDRKKRGARREPLQWRAQIPLIGLTLLVADFLYFSALQDPEALVSVVSPIRRSAVLIAFAGGALIYREKNIARKALCVALILIGVFILSAA